MYIDRHLARIEEQFTRSSLRKWFARRHRFGFDLAFEVSVLALYLALLARRPRHLDHGGVVRRLEWIRSGRQ